MKYIIQQITEKFVKNIMEYHKQNGIHDIGAMAHDISAMTKETSLELLRAFIEDADASLVAMKAERRADGVSIHERNVNRTLYTDLGSLTYNRTFFNTPNGMMYIIDKVMGVEAYERVDKHVSAHMVNEAADVSFAKSTAIVTGGAISRQTAHRKAIGCKEVVAMPKRLSVTPERIHIFADEDHVHLQDGTNAILPLVTICSGKRKLSKGRYELTDRVCLNGYRLRPEKLWEYTYAVCAEMFDMDKVKEIFIYGDGARWIDTSDMFFTGALHVMDAHHYRQKMKILTAGEICSRYSAALYSAVKSARKDTFLKTVSKMIDSLHANMQENRERERKIKRVRDAASYIIGQWDKVMNMKHDGSIGSATEALVSHVLSARFSRSPMGWSKEGLSKMAQIRIFLENGGMISANDIVSGKRNGGDETSVPVYIKKYDDLIKKRQDEVLLKARDWRIFEHENIAWAAPSGTKVMLDALARTRNIA